MEGFVLLVWFWLDGGWLLGVGVGGEEVVVVMG